MSEVMERLKSGTWDLHQQAEGNDFQRRMVDGAISRAEYAAWLGQMHLVHDALEGPLARMAGSESRFAAVRPEQMQVPYLLEDLAALGVPADGVEPLPATRELVDRIGDDAEREPLALLGYHYVLEGSNNGNRFIARRLLPALGLQDGAGGRYLDPYGSAQRDTWRAFKEEMAAIPFDEEEIETLVGAARRMFRAVSAISSQLAERSPAGTPAG